MTSFTDAAKIHSPVLLTEVISFLNLGGPGYYLDGTLGLGGHAESLLQINPNATIVGLDRDGEALEYARRRLAPYKDRLRVWQANYADFPKVLNELEIQALDGAMLDLGVSSLQLDFAKRGFSFLSSAKLDMRMDQSASIPTAYDLVNTQSFAWLKKTLSLGEEVLAERIAKNIVAARQLAPITTTKELADLVCRSYPKHWLKTSRHHPATKTFQALRLAVNHELDHLEVFLKEILGWLKPKGRLVILTFHSLEDRLVKHFMQERAQGCICPPYVTKCVCQHQPEVKILTKKPLKAKDAELAINPRAASAKLRCLEKL